MSYDTFAKSFTVKGLFVNNMSEFIGPDMGSEKPGPRPLLRDLLVETTFKPGRAISPEIDELDIGVFSEEARQLANECFLNPDSSNYGKIVYVTGSKKVRVPRTASGEISDGVLPLLGKASKIPREIAKRDLLNEPYIAMLIHTNNNIDFAFSATGLAALLGEDSLPFSTSALFVAGQTQNMLVFRGESAPQLSLEDIEKKTRLWLWQLRERVHRFAKPGMDREEVNGIAGTAGKTLLRQICQKYDLSFFAGSSDTDEVVRQNP